eukprot:m.330451 g.330451  ORF g.330451 m.330451 type:complete len:1629 (+) comp19763_c0_seq7:586-5472(+)
MGKGQYDLDHGDTGTHRVPSKGQIAVCITHLDRTDYHFLFEKASTGLQVLDAMCSKVHLVVETEYFGLCIPNSEPLQWIDPQTPLRRQHKSFSKGTIQLEFSVRFFVSDPQQLVDDVTRNLLFLQLKNDLATGQFVCRPEVAFRLCAFVLQADLGNVRQGMVADDLDAFALLPTQTGRVQTDVFQLYQKLTGMTNAEAELQFLLLASQQELYGADLHPVQSPQGLRMYIGLTAKGLRVFDGKLKPLETSPWSGISTLKFDGKYFLVGLKPNDIYGTHTVRRYKCGSLADSKHLWKAAVVEHTFFRRRQQPVLPAPSPLKALKLDRRNPHQRSKWHGRTEQEAISHARKATVKLQERQFERTNTLSKQTARPRTQSLHRVLKDAPSSYGWDVRDPRGYVDDGQRYGTSLHGSDGGRSNGTAGGANDLINTSMDFSRFERIGNTAIPVPSPMVEEEQPEATVGSTSFGAWNVETNFLGSQEPAIQETMLDHAAGAASSAFESRAISQGTSAVAPLAEPATAPGDVANGMGHHATAVPVVDFNVDTLDNMDDLPDFDEAAADESYSIAGHLEQATNDVAPPSAKPRIPEPPAYSPPSHLDRRGIPTPPTARRAVQPAEEQPAVEQAAVSSIAAAAAAAAAARTSSSSTSVVLPQQVSAVEHHLVSPEPEYLAAAHHGTALPLPSEVAASEEHVQSPEPVLVSSPSKDGVDRVESFATTLSTLLDQSFAQLDDEESCFVQALVTVEGTSTFATSGEPNQHIGCRCNDILNVKGVSEAWWRVENLSTGAEGVVPSPARFGVLSSFTPVAESRDMPAADSEFGPASDAKAQLQMCQLRALQARPADLPAQFPLAAYELVTHETAEGQIRPIIILGPSKDHVIDMLIAEHEHLFHTCVPHTTRPQRDGEINGADYVFVSMEEMEKGIGEGKFAETVRFQGNLYGTSFAAIQEAAALDGHCLLDVSDPTTLVTVKQAGISPITIFLRPSNANVIQEQNDGLDFDSAHALLELATATEGDFGPYFTAVVTNNDLSAATREVFDIIVSQAARPFWCPVALELPNVDSAVADERNRLVPPPASESGTSRSTSPAMSATSGAVVASETISFARGPGGLGFSFSGGSDAPTVPGDSGVYVTKIAPGGAAEMDGRLQFGDRIVAANGVDFTNITNAQVVSVIKSNPTAVKLKVTRTCVPVTLFPENGRYGLGIRGGSDSKQPVTISRIAVNSPAARHERLEIGQEITHVNGDAIHHLTHAQVLDLIRSSTEQLELIIHPRKSRASKKHAPTEAPVKAAVATASSPRETVPQAPVTPVPAARSSVSSQGTVATVSSQAASPASSPERTELKTVRSLQPLPPRDSSKRKVFGGNFSSVHLFRKGYSKSRDCSVALQADNSARNRYKDILPYNDTRVLLQTEDNDYINANHVTYSNDVDEFRYIACQGPKEGTAGHFWLMVWEQNTSLIVMLTGLRESGRTKCFQYWPKAAGETVEFGDFSVSLDDEQQHDSFAVRRFAVTHLPTARSRQIAHAHFTGWPDHGVPKDSDHFLAFVEHVQRIKAETLQNTVVLHCSAGIGRTGVYIVLELSLAHFQQNQAVELPAMLRKLRAQRMGLVQTEAQYTFCYTTLARVRRDEGPSFRVLP